jgi:hypothetical protein
MDMGVHNHRCPPHKIGKNFHQALGNSSCRSGFVCEIAENDQNGLENSGIINDVASHCLDSCFRLCLRLYLDAGSIDTARTEKFYTHSDGSLPEIINI